VSRKALRLRDATGVTEHAHSQQHGRQGRARDGRRIRSRACHRTLAVNLSGPIYLSQAAIPHLLKVSGAIVNVTSSAAFVGEAYAAAYCASKAGLTQMTKALAMEYTHKPIRINAVAPGGMATNIAANLKMPPDVDYALIKRYSGLRGLVDVNDVAELIAFLASDAARGYHGACISIDRGITAG
jgi:NAD(P)-dependent dehydrogenase (short-subunit alcohol dehydrogenase family)